MKKALKILDINKLLVFLAISFVVNLSLLFLILIGMITVNIKMVQTLHYIYVLLLYLCAGVGIVWWLLIQFKSLFLSSEYR
jgi:hypothetical protein